MNDNIIKKTLTFKEQIKHLQKRGITFDRINTEDAKKFLIYSNYFYKLYSYCSKNSKIRQYKKLYKLFHIDNPIFNDIKYKNASSILYSTFKFIDTIIVNNYNKYCNNGRKI